MANKIQKRAPAPMLYNNSIRVDEEPIKNSEALITSGAVAEALSNFSPSPSPSTYVKPILLDFTEWDDGIFTETVDGNLTTIYHIQFDENNRPISFIDPVGHVTNVLWD